MTFVQPLSPPPSRPEPALTRVARAVWNADPSNPPFDSLIEGRFSWNLAHDQARAALTAIREPSDGMMTPFAHLESWQMPDTKGRWSAMVDHILNGGD